VSVVTAPHYENEANDGTDVSQVGFSSRCHRKEGLKKSLPRRNRDNPSNAHSQAIYLIPAY
jgi:hypothetical protein